MSKMFIRNKKVIGGGRVVAKGDVKLVLVGEAVDKPLEFPVKVFNRDIVVYGDHFFMVSTFGGDSNKCSLIDLKNGSRACSENCSRNTTNLRLLAHLRSYPQYDQFGNDSKFNVIRAADYYISIVASNKEY